MDPVYWNSEMFFPPGASRSKIFQGEPEQLPKEYDDEDDEEPQNSYWKSEMFFPPGASRSMIFQGEPEQLPEGYDDEEPQYSPQINKLRRSSRIKKTVNLVSFLSQNSNKGRGKRLWWPYGRDFVSTQKQLKGHYVLVCSFLLPMAKCLAEHCLSVLYLCQEMSAQGKRFKLVIVPKIRPRWEHEAGLVFNHFLSAFEKYNCLAVPWWDTDSCDAICMSLGMTHGNTEGLLLVSPQGEVLQTHFGFLHTYGAASFPFTREHLLNLRKEDNKLMVQMHPLSTYVDDDDDFLMKSVGGEEELNRLRETRLSVFDLLECDSLCAIGGDKKKTYSDDIDNKLVGVYLCLDGGFMDRLIDFQRECREKQLDLVIVLVSLAFNDYPSNFLKPIEDALLKRSISNWLLFPYNDKICRRLWRLCGRSVEDQLIMVPPGNEPGEIKGKALIRTYGMTAFPTFTRSFILETKLSRLRSVKLASLLSTALGSTVVLVPTTKGSPAIPVSDLQGKKVIMCLDYFSRNLRLCSKLREYYIDNEDEFVGCQVLIVPMDNVPDPVPQGCPSYEQFDDLPWMMLRDASASMIDQLFLRDLNEYPNNPCILAFGEDGRLLSRDGSMSDLEDELFVELIFRDNLRQEIINDLADLGLDDY